MQLLKLCASRRFGPLLVTQFLGAFNDNLFKNAFLVSLIFGRGLESNLVQPGVFITIAAGLFILPYVLFSSLAGELADKYEKSKLVIIIKCVELVLMLFVALGFYMQSPWLLLVALFFMGAQSAFFSPLKYSLVPDHLQKHEVMAGNAILEASTFLSILLGTIAGGLLAGMDNGIVIACVMLCALSLLGIASARAIPRSGPYVPSLTLTMNLAVSTKRLVKVAFADKVLGKTVIGISWFWMLGAAMLSQFPAWGKDTLGGDEQVVTLLLTAFSIGIGVGSFAAHALLKEAISSRYVVASMLFMSAFIIDLTLFAEPALLQGKLHNAASFMSSLENIRILFDLTMIAVAGGVYIVPLNAILQTRPKESERSRMIAANNVINALTMFAASILFAIGLLSGLQIEQMFLLMGVINLLLIVAMRRLNV